MTPPFSVYVTARFERDYRRLLKGRADLTADYETVLLVLHSDQVTVSSACRSPRPASTWVSSRVART